MCRTIKKVILLVLILVSSGCETDNNKSTRNMFKKHDVFKTSKPVKLCGDWSGDSWGDVATIDVKHWMGDEPEHKPRTQAKLMYDNEYIYVIFCVEDKYVRAVANNYQDAVSQDSCVEFFFSPGEDISSGYFNIEINCGGVLLVRHTKIVGGGGEKISRKFSADNCKRIEIYHSEPKIVEPEKQKPTTWIIEYKVPFDLLEDYCQISRPEAGVKWLANFYKCADMTSQPHWLTWSVVDHPMPQFHMPEFFGTLEFR